MPDTSWGLCTYRDAGGADALGALRRSDGGIVAVPEGDGGLAAAMADWSALDARLRDWHPRGLPPVPGAQLLAPLRFPSKLLCAGVNYGSHVAEMGGALPGPDWEPWFFLKPPTTTVVGTGAPIAVDPDEQVDWEGELGIVIGHGGKSIGTADAADHVAGFTVLNDISARGPHRRADVPHDAFRYDWLASKAQDGFCPMGPVVVPRRLLPDPDDQRLRLWVNDELKQDSRVGDMHVGWRDLVSAASARVTLEPGDVIAAGTPAGVGMARGEFLQPGDVVRVEIEGIGALSNPVVGRDRVPPRGVRASRAARGDGT